MIDSASREGQSTFEGCLASPFSSHERKGGKGYIESLQELTGTEKSRDYLTVCYPLQIIVDGHTGDTERKKKKFRTI